LTSRLTSYAPLNNPSFTGSVNCPTINATTSLQVNGTDLSVLYQPKPYVQGQVNSNGSIVTNNGRVQFAVSSRTANSGIYTLTWTNSGTSSCGLYELTKFNRIYTV